MENTVENEIKQSDVKGCVNCRYLMRHPFLREYDCPIVKFDSMLEMPNYLCSQWKERI